MALNQEIIYSHTVQIADIDHDDQVDMFNLWRYISTAEGKNAAHTRMQKRNYRTTTIAPHLGPPHTLKANKAEEEMTEKVENFYKMKGGVWGCECEGKGSNHLTHAAIIGHDGSVWAQSSSFPQEPWLLHDFNEDFYGEELRLVIVGYIRPEANFSFLESLVAKIQEDRGVAERALDLPLFSSFKNDSYLRSS
ncbi:hypothetical protein V8G54_002374 [Vigna mungo]|uniref:riboflavin kinase n=1 Tax=Vigna mungo TaxID=3915 RepID=A0AAQ3PA21_VIGMU